MTNLILPDIAADHAAELMAIAGPRGKRRPVKVVEHPAFRPYRIGVAFDAPFVVIRIPVVSLNRAVAHGPDTCRVAGPTLLTTSQEAA